MNRNTIIGIVFSLALAGLTACSRRHSEPITGTTVDMSRTHVRNGHVLFDRYCYHCHPSGQSGLGPEVTNKPGFARRFQVRHGLGVMPSFKNKVIEKEELNDIMAYLNNLHGQK